ncbi:MAG: hypothetical protein ABEH56_06175 [Salinirussus sp.]
MTSSDERPRGRRRDPVTVVASHLRRLGDSALASFVADLWAVRGFETERADRTVRATRNGETRVIQAVGRRLGTGAVPDGQADVVVAPGGQASRPAESGIRVLDATDLAEMLLYAVDRQASTALCRRHLGGAPAELNPPLRTRLRERVRTKPAVSAVLAAAAVAGLLAVSVVVVLGASALTAPGLPGDGAGPAGEARSPLTPLTDVPIRNARSGGPPTNDSRPPGPSELNESMLPPGVGTGGVTDPGSLAAAHDRALTNRSYTLSMEYRGPENRFASSGRVRRTLDVAVADDRYLLSVRTGPAGNTSIARSVFYDGSDWHVARFTDNGTVWSVDRVPGEKAGRRPRPSPFELEEKLVTRYLSTPRTRIDGSPGSDQLVTVRGRGTPESVETDTVRNYTVTALVDPQGLVRQVSVEYTLVTSMMRTDVSIEMSYSRFDATSVEAPVWYDAGTSTGGHDPTTPTP